MLAQGSRTKKALLSRHAHCPALETPRWRLAPVPAPSPVHLPAPHYSGLSAWSTALMRMLARPGLFQRAVQVNVTFPLQPPSLTGSPPILAGFCTLCADVQGRVVYTGVVGHIYTVHIYISIYIFYIHIYIVQNISLLPKTFL